MDFHSEHNIKILQYELTLKREREKCHWALLFFSSNFNISRFREMFSDSFSFGNQDAVLKIVFF